MSRHPTVTSDTQHITLDVARTTDASNWKGILTGVDAVINAAGALHGQDLRAVHVAGSAALYAACESAGIRRVILFSAIGSNREAISEFSRTKYDGEAALMARNVDWVVLRPSRGGPAGIWWQRAIARARIPYDSTGHAGHRSYSTGASRRRGRDGGVLPATRRSRSRRA
ncbi:NAD(P)H-binding protein [Bradyrhizobium sp. USDA 372]